MVAEAGGRSIVLTVVRLLLAKGTRHIISDSIDRRIEGKFPAAMTLSVFMAAWLLTSTLGAFLLLTGTAPVSASNGDLIVQGSTFAIEDCELPIDGNVSILDGGELILRRATLNIISGFDPALRHSITISNGSRLFLEDSSITSNCSIEALVNSNSSVTATNASFCDITLTAFDSTFVCFENVSMTNGSLLSSSDAMASFEIVDAEFSDPVQISGESVGNFTDVEAPSIHVSGNGTANIYRWIHVTVLDDNDKPLPGVLVSTRFYVSGIPANSAVTCTSPDSLGVAKIIALGTKITSLGSTFVGNYWVNASYDTYMGIYSGPELSVGVMPYSEPLQKNTTYVTMKISGILPDLTIPSTPAPVTFNNTSPGTGDSVAVYARITNQGLAYAYDVAVNFYDDMYNTSVIHEYELFATTTIPMIAPGSYAIAQGNWTAVPPREPMAHRIIIFADPLNAIPEMDEVVAANFGFIVVQSLPDLYMVNGESQIWTDPGVVVVDVQCSLNADVYNVGTSPAYDVLVDFYDCGNLVDSCVIPFIDAGHLGDASVLYTFDSVGIHVINVSVNPDRTIIETSYTNNDAHRNITVLDHPNLAIGNLTVAPSPQIPGGSVITVMSTLTNENPAPFYNPIVRLYANFSGISVVQERSILGVFRNSSGSVQFLISFVAPVVIDPTEMNITVILNPDHTQEETTYSDNVALTTVEIIFNLPPTANAGPDQVAFMGEALWLNGNGSSDDDEIVNYTWSFEYDGTAVELYGENVSFVFLVEGIYNVTLTVTDSFGQSSNDTVQVTVAGVIPEFPTLILPISSLLILVIVCRLRPRCVKRRIAAHPEH